MVCRGVGYSVFGVSGLGSFTWHLELRVSPILKGVGEHELNLAMSALQNPKA